MIRDQYHGLEHKRAPIALAAVADDGTFSGYATLFGKVDLGQDRVQKGAFAHSLAKRGTRGIRMLFQHDPGEPIGTWEVVREDARGLYVRGRIIAGSTRGREVLNLMRGGAIDGLSIGFRTEKSRTERVSGVRTILQADLWEISIVTFPMLPQARVLQVKSPTPPQRAGLPSVRCFEHWLTQDAGLTRSQARCVIQHGFAALAGKLDAARLSNAALTRRLRRLAASIQPIQTH